MTKERGPVSLGLDRERILALLTGERFYSNESAALREVVLNAVDAIHRRRSTAQGLDPSIVVIFDRNEFTLTVSDNGTGMNWSTVKKLFATIGASAATDEPVEQSVGEFGIGIASYFMAGDQFDLHTFDGTDDPIGLRFAIEMLHDGVAADLPPEQNHQGTTIRIYIRNQEIFDLLLKEYPHWCWDVEGLSARVLPDDYVLSQGGAARRTGIAPAEPPAWLQRAYLGPVSTPTGWSTMTGSSTVSVLYRGVFVQDVEAKGLWGIEGSIDVDPKEFKPRLNREGFVDGPFQKAVEGFLHDCHPGILAAMADQLRSQFESGALGEWTERRWANLWLSVPRRDPYSAAMERWDALFRSIPAFELAVGNKWRAATFDEIADLQQTVFLAPAAGEGSNDVINAATRFLRNTGKVVIRGIRREKSWMPDATWSYRTTGQMVAGVFVHDLTKLVQLVSEAQDLLTKIEPLAPLFTGPPPVDLVALGTDSPPALRLRNRLIINVDSVSGRAVVEDVLRENRGPMSLVESAARHAYEQLPQVAASVRKISTHEIFGPVRRRFIRGLLS